MADGTVDEAEIEPGWRAANFARDLATGTLPTIPRRYKVPAVRRASWVVYEPVGVLDPSLTPAELLEILHNDLSNALDYLGSSISCWGFRRVGGAVRSTA